MSEYLIHTTSKGLAQTIATEGLLAVSYWAQEGEVSNYYSETVEDDGEIPMEIRLPLSVLLNYEPEPDFPGLEEPLTHTLGLREEEVWEAWGECAGQTWRDCLDLIQSIRCRSAIPASVIKEYNPALTIFDGDEPKSENKPRQLLAR